MRTLAWDEPLVWVTWKVVAVPAGGGASFHETVKVTPFWLAVAEIVDAKKMPDRLIEEMGLLYVGVACARKAVYVSASMQRRTKYGNYQVACPSCLSFFRALSQ